MWTMTDLPVVHSLSVPAFSEYVVRKFYAVLVYRAVVGGDVEAVARRVGDEPMVRARCWHRRF